MVIASILVVATLAEVEDVKEAATVRPSRLKKLLLL